MPTNDGGPVFTGVFGAEGNDGYTRVFLPDVTAEWIKHAGGMSLLDWFAGLALQGILAAGESSWPCACEKAYQFADTMLAERERRSRVNSDKD